MKTRPRMIKRTPPTFAARTTPLLRFSPTAWAKLLFLREAGETEIGGFGISRRDALLDVNDLVLIPQTTTAVSVEFDDLAVATFFEEQVGHGRQPAEFARIWVHTHPGDCPLPSATDEATFARVFGACDWAVMLILARRSKLLSTGLECRSAGGHGDPRHRRLFAVVHWQRSGRLAGRI